MLTKTIDVEIKAIGDEGEGRFQAYASTFGVVDSYGDMVVQGAFAETLGDFGPGGADIPLYWRHRMDDPFMLIGKTLAAKEDELRYLVRNEEELLPTMGYGYKFSVTPDSSRYAYVSPCGENVKCMVINGKIGPEFTDIWDPARFSADGTRHGYEAKRGEEALLIVDDQEVSHGYGPLKGVSGLTFSPDSKRWAAAFTFGEDEYAVLVDGKEIARRSGSPRKIVFSPDGSRVAWLEKQKDVWHALLDGQPGPDVREIFDEEPPQFRPDGENLVYFFRDQEDRIHLAIFGKEERVHEIIAPRAVFTPGGIDYMAIDGTRFRRESIPIQ